ncbi:hypothetical protein GOODEAATRI_014377 [Goodea atripinnis]|uniref:Uncharacterized protein n=1 Tax=Goodea atripinnis TaxID=208336 RepID=A0ABV0N3H5_9TELE
MFFSHDVIYFVNCTTPSFSKTPPQHNASTTVLHSWDVIQHFNFRVHLQTPFWDNCFFLHVDKRLVSHRKMTLFPDTIFTRSYAFLLEFICTFRTKTCPSLKCRTCLLSDQYDAWTLP